MLFLTDYTIYIEKEGRRGRIENKKNRNYTIGKKIILEGKEKGRKVLEIEENVEM